MNGDDPEDAAARIAAVAARRLEDDPLAPPLAGATLQGGDIGVAREREAIVGQYGEAAYAAYTSWINEQPDQPWYSQFALPLAVWSEFAPYVTLGTSGAFERILGGTDMAVWGDGWGDGGWEDVFTGGGNGGLGGTFGDFLKVGQQVGGLLRSWTDQDTGAGSGDVVVSNGGGGGMVQTGGLGGAVVAGGVWLGSFLARALGRGGASAIFTAANGIKVRLHQLMPLVRKYGGTAVAGALGISIGELGALLAQPGALVRPRRRARGISGSDIRRTRRTIRKLKQLVRMSGIRMGGGRWRAHHHHRSYR